MTAIKNLVGAGTVVALVAIAMNLTAERSPPQADHTEPAGENEVAAEMAASPAETPATVVRTSTPDVSATPLTVTAGKFSFVDKGDDFNGEEALKGAALVADKPQDVLRIRQVQLNASDDLKDYQSLVSTLKGYLVDAYQVEQCGIRDGEWYANIRIRITGELEARPDIVALRSRLSEDEKKATEGSVKLFVRGLMDRPPFGCEDLKTIPYLRILDAYSFGYGNLPVWPRSR